MRNFISSRAKDIPPSGIRKFFDLILTMEDVISLGVGEPDFNTPWSVSEAGIYAIEQGHTSYTSNKGLLPLRQLLSRAVAEKRNMDTRCRVLQRDPYVWVPGSLGLPLVDHAGFRQGTV